MHHRMNTSTPSKKDTVGRPQCPIPTPRPSERTKHGKHARWEKHQIAPLPCRDLAHPPLWPPEPTGPGAACRSSGVIVSGVYFISAASCQTLSPSGDRFPSGRSLAVPCGVSSSQSFCISLCASPIPLLHLVTHRRLVCKSRCAARE